MRSFPVALAFAMAPLSSAFALTHSYDWSSTVTSLTVSGFLGIEAGDTITGTFVLDDAATATALPKTTGSGPGYTYGPDVFESFSTSATGAVAVNAASVLNVGDNWFLRPNAVTAYWRDGWNLEIKTVVNGVSGSIFWNVADNVLRDMTVSTDAASSTDLGIAPILMNAENVSVIFDFPGLEEFSGQIGALEASAAADVPAPAAAPLLLTGIAAVAAAARRRRG